MNSLAAPKLCMVIGDPVEHSLSPVMHNAAYRELGLDNEYRYTACQVIATDIGDFIRDVRARGIRGVSCTIPHKVSVMSYLDVIDDIAQKIGAVNTVVNDNGALTGYNTDWLGAVAPLEQMASLEGKRVALLGAGGAARAMAYGVTSRGAQLTIYNRDTDKATVLAEAFGATTGSLKEPQAITDMDIIINATSVGLYPDQDVTPLDQQYITDQQIVFDAVYSPYDTRLLREAKQRGAQIIHGTEMLLHQGMAQFKLYTGHEAPETVMRAALMQALLLGQE